LEKFNKAPQQQEAQPAAPAAAANNANNNAATTASQSLFNVTGMDISDTAIEHATQALTKQVGENLTSKYFKTLQTNIMEEDLEANKYDVIICFFAQVRCLAI